MNKVISIAIFMCVSTTTLGQLSSKAVYLEAGGNGGYNSLNFDYRLNNFAFKLGLGYYVNKDVDYLSVPLGNLYFKSVPFAISYLIGNEKHNMETGIGITYFNITGKSVVLLNATVLDTLEKDTYHSFNLVPRIGYRYQPQDAGLFISFAFTPNLNIRMRRLIYHQKIWFGFAIGYAF